MKTFAELREAAKPQTFGGEQVFSKKMGKYPVVINKDKKGYSAFIDGDFLDTFKSESDAMKAIQQMLKAL
jgi:hypothetical protein